MHAMYKRNKQQTENLHVFYLCGSLQSKRQEVRFLFVWITTKQETRGTLFQSEEEKEIKKKKTRGPAKTTGPL